MEQRPGDDEDEHCDRGGRDGLHSTSNSSPITGSIPIRSGTWPRSGRSSPRTMRPKRSWLSFEIQYDPSGRSGRRSRSSASEVCES
jgi:hypothetical protein